MLDELRQWFEWYVTPATVFILIGILIGAVATGAAVATFGWLR